MWKVCKATCTILSSDSDTKIVARDIINLTKLDCLFFYSDSLSGWFFIPLAFFSSPCIIFFISFISLFVDL